MMHVLEMRLGACPPLTFRGVRRFVGSKLKHRTQSGAEREAGVCRAARVADNGEVFGMIEVETLSDVIAIVSQANVPVRLDGEMVTTADILKEMVRGR
ncbi:MAG: hypothetical protein ACRECN_02950 [Methylocella sp.]